MSERRMRYKCHGCGKVWYQDFDSGPRIGVMSAIQGAGGGTTYGHWGPRCPNGCLWCAQSFWKAESYEQRVGEPEEEVFL